MSIESNNEKGMHNGKCIDCGACGDSNCCSPVQCKMTFSSTYCLQYLNELRFTYEGYGKLYELIYNQQEKNPGLFGSAEEINDELQTKIMEQNG